MDAHKGYATVSRSWFDPGRHDEIVGLDFGSGTAALHFLRAGIDEHSTIESLPARLLALAPKTAVVVEAAHMGRAQTSQSKAQPFTAETLLGLYADLDAKGVTLRLAPHQHSRRMREWSARYFPKLVSPEKGSDINDARAIACYVEHKNAISLMRPPRTFVRSRQSIYGERVRASSNVVLNDASCRGYEGQVHPMTAKLAEDLAWRLNRPGNFISVKVAFTILSLMVCEHGGRLARFVLNGRPVGWRRFKEVVLKTSPFHERGGRARSNIYWHSLRPFFERKAREFGVSVKSGSKYVRHADYSESQEAAKQAAFRDMRDQLKKAYWMAVEMTDGLDSFEVLGETMEAKQHGR